MPFTTISWKGIGEIAKCDALLDSLGGTWAELGGGGISANTDNPLVPPASIGHVYASKSGYGYYTTPATYDFSPGGNAEGQYIYIMIQIQSASAFDTFANNGFAFVVGTDTNNHKYFQLASSEVGGGDLFDGGGWKLFVIDPTKIGSIADKGTFNLATINMVGLWMDTIVSVRADTIFIGSLAIGSGIQVTGDGTLEEIVDYCTDYSLRSWPVFRKEGRSYFGYGSLIAGDNASATINTTLTSTGKSVEFRNTKFWNGSTYVLSHPSTYNKLIVEKHVSYTTEYVSENTSLLSNADAKLTISSDVGAVIDINGGAIDLVESITTRASDTLNNVVLVDVNASSIANTPIGCTWNTSGLVTLETGGGLDACLLNKSTGTIAVTGENAGDVVDTHFISSGIGHAFEATVNQNQSWENTASGYGADDTTDAVFYNNSGGSFNLSVIGNGTVPTVRTLANTNVISGTVTVRVKITNKAGIPLEGVRVYVTKNIGGAVVLNGLTNSLGIIEDTGYVFTVPEAISGRARFNQETVYKTGNLAGTIESNGVQITQSLILD